MQSKTLVPEPRPFFLKRGVDVAQDAADLGGLVAALDALGDPMIADNRPSRPGKRLLV